MCVYPSTPSNGPTGIESSQAGDAQELSHAPRSPPTRILILSQMGIHESGIQENRRRPEKLSTRSWSFGTPNRRRTGKSGIACLLLRGPSGATKHSLYLPSPATNIATTQKSLPIRYSFSAIFNRPQRW